jgi:PilZ domain
MSYVLAIEPAESQAGVLRETVSAAARTTMKVVSTLEAAMAAIDDEVPKLVLLNALMHPRDEERLMGRLRRLPGEIAPQVLITPALAAPEGASAARRSGLFDRFRKPAWRPAPCEPSVFAGELSLYLDDRTRTGADRRTARRVEGLDFARMVIDGAAVELVDLSLVGAQVRSPILLPAGGSVQLLLSSGPDLESLRCDAAIVWGTPDETAAAESGRYRAGMRFKNVDHQLLHRLYFGARTLTVRQNGDGKPFR